MLKISCIILLLMPVLAFIMYLIAVVIFNDVSEKIGKTCFYITIGLLVLPVIVITGVIIGKNNMEYISYYFLSTLICAFISGAMAIIAQKDGFSKFSRIVKYIAIGFLILVAIFITVIAVI